MTATSARSATFWSAADTLLRQGAQFLVSVALARLLSPEEFGTIALLALFVGIAGTFVESGMSSALIQRQDVSATDEATVFWFNLGAGFVMAVALWLAAPSIAALYATPVLEPLCGVLALNLIVSATSSIHQTLCIKRLDFRPLLYAGAASILVSGAIAIGLAWAGFGVWALAAQALATSCVTSALLWWWSPWRPSFVFSVASARRLFGFGGYVLASSLLEICYSRAYTLLIGKLYSARDLGFYARADSTAALPGSVLNAILARVAFAHFARRTEDAAGLRRDLQLAQQTSMLLNAPALLGLAATAEPLITTLFGAKWLPAAPVLQALCLSGLLLPLHALNLQVLMALGHSHLFLRLEIIKKAIGVCVLVASAPFGVLAIAWGMVAASAAALLVNTHFTRKFLGYGALAQLRDVAPCTGAAAAMAAAVFQIRPRLALSSPPAELAVCVACGAVIYFALILALRAPELAALRKALAAPQGQT